jgi:phage FluMu gp28-like protein
MKIDLYQPYNKQEEVHQGLANEGYLFDTVCAGRQTGKTMLGMNQAIKWALENENSTIMWVSPTSSQTHKVYKNILKSITDAPFIQSYKGTMGDIEIKFTNGSIIKFKSSMAEDNLRGETVNYMIIDEAAFVKETVFLEILLPMLNVAGKKCLIISTPKGRSNWFHKQYIKGVNGSKGYRSYRFTCYTNPYANPEIIKIAKDNMPDPIFKQEYMAEFVEGSAIIENIEEVCTLRMHPKPIEGIKYYAGVDIALKNDYTVFSIIDEDGNFVYYDRFKGVSSPELKERLSRNIRMWQPENTMIEVNNMGGVIYDDLTELYNLKNLTPFTTTQNSKNEIITDLLNAFSGKSIKCVNDAVLKSELEVFEMKVHASGRVSYAAANGFYDDLVMSLAIARKAHKTAYKNVFGLKMIG